MDYPPSSKEMQKYMSSIEESIKKERKIATECRKKGYDPEDKVDIPLARTMAERVEGLMSIVAPQIVGSGMTERIKRLEKEYGALDWRVALKIAEEVAKEKFCKFKDRKEAIEVGIRVGMAYNTAGIVAAPLEGFIEAKIKKRRDGKEYLGIFYAGPIRGAGGTAAAFSVILSDYVRQRMGLDRYDPDDKEIERYVIEIQDYNDRVTNLQYNPSPEEIRFMVKNLGVEVNGDPTEQIEVSNHKDLDRIETNLIRGGVCLVVAEGLTQKAPKMWKRLAKWGKDFELDWNFLEEFLEIKAKVHAKSSKKEGDNVKLKPNNTFISDLVAGRPILSFPMADGGFRLRYGRGRVNGFSAASIHPATMAVLDDFIAIGTQLKVERPGKGAAMTVNENIEGPIVRLKDGSVLQLNDAHQAKRMEIEEILFLGDILFNYGDFSENGHKLVPPGYCPEWWVQEFERSIIKLQGTIDYEKIGYVLNVQPNIVEQILKKPYTFFPSANLSLKISKEFSVPLHPRYIYFWKLIDKYELFYLFNWLSNAKRVEKDGKLAKIICKLDDRAKKALEKAGVEHIVVNSEFIVVGKDSAVALLSNFGLYYSDSLKDTTEKVNDYIKRIDDLKKSNIEILSDLSGVTIRDKAGTFIGARMGRPEKAKMRKLQGSPHVLFPVGEEGGRMRSFQAAIEKKYISGDFAIFYCPKCKEERLFHTCEVCGERTKAMFYNPKKNSLVEKKDDDLCIRYKSKSIDINALYKGVLDRINISPIPKLVKGVRGTSNKDHIPEHIVKGILRAKWDIYVNKDGTTRYDLTELPMTHFKPSEIGVSVEKLRELGYDKDYDGNPLVDENQICEIKPQDIIIPNNRSLVDESTADVLFRVSKFIDDMLEKWYGVEPYYNFRSKEDLIGTLVIGLAPHISAGTVGRIIGFTKAQALFAHPLFHAALRRDCDGDEACLLLLMDGFLNFSRQYLPDKRGSRTMDSPLVLTTIINPTEVDDMAHGLDIVRKYPLEFYEAAMEYKNPWDVKIEQISHVLNTERQYEGMKFTIDTDNINNGVLVSSYKTLPSMKDKLLGQMELAKRIKAVDEMSVADLVIQKHFLKDIMGNLKKFSQQKFRCVKCNAKYRRPPLSGRCTECKDGKIIFTISHGSIVKYLEPSLELAEVFNVNPYIKQTLDLLKLRVESVFGREKEKQSGLSSWI